MMLFLFYTKKGKVQGFRVLYSTRPRSHEYFTHGTSLPLKDGLGLPQTYLGDEISKGLHCPQLAAIFYDPTSRVVDPDSY
jgi:hypothetical protein